MFLLSVSIAQELKGLMLEESVSTIKLALILCIAYSSGTSPIIYKPERRYLIKRLWTDDPLAVISRKLYPILPDFLPFLLLLLCLSASQLLVMDANPCALFGFFLILYSTCASFLINVVWWFISI